MQFHNIGRKRLISVGYPDTISYLVPGKDPEGLHHLFSRIRVCRLAGHEVQKRLERNHSRVVWIYDRHDSLEVSLTLLQQLEERFYINPLSMTQVSFTSTK